jgi:DNA-binding transcriptional MerR regulator
MNKNFPFKDTDEKKQKYTIDEISELSGFSRRTIRYYIQNKLIDPPSGRGRGGFYSDSHLSGLQKIRALQGEKVNLESIRNILHGEKIPASKNFKTPVRDIRVRYEVIPGLEINISRKLEEEKSKKIRETIRFIKSIFKTTAGNQTR